MIFLHRHKEMKISLRKVTSQSIAWGSYISWTSLQRHTLRALSLSPYAFVCDTLASRENWSALNMARTFSSRYSTLIRTSGYLLTAPVYWGVTRPLWMGRPINTEAGHTICLSKRNLHTFCTLDVILVWNHHITVAHYCTDDVKQAFIWCQADSLFVDSCRCYGVSLSPKGTVMSSICFQIPHHQSEWI